MRGVAQDVPILERARLALVRIADDVFVALEILGHEAPFETGRETGTATPTQRGFFDLINHLGDLLDLPDSRFR